MNLFWRGRKISESAKFLFSWRSKTNGRGSSSEQKDWWRTGATIIYQHCLQVSKITILEEVFEIQGEIAFQYAFLFPLGVGKRWQVYIWGCLRKINSQILGRKADKSLHVNKCHAAEVHPRKKTDRRVRQSFIRCVPGPKRWGNIADPA